jgi:hypothetical protein
MFSVDTYHAGGSASKKKTFSFEKVDTQYLQTEQSRPSFEIFKESVVHEQFREDNIAPYSATDELQCPQICTGKCKDAVIIKLFLATTSRPLLILHFLLVSL